jgi:beta-mannanase
MPIQFRPGWNIANPYYTQHYGYYQGFLDSIDQNQIRNGLADAIGHFNNPVAQTLVNAANSNNPNNMVVVEQGVHQDEDLPTGGFTLHFTARYNQQAYHLYVGQRNNGSIYIRRITWRQNNQIVQDNYQ